MSYSPLNTKNRISFVVDTSRVPGFFKEYPIIKKTMLEFVGTKHKTIDSYINWLNKYGENRHYLGGYPETVVSPSFGTKTFYKFNWDGISGYAELFQYLTDKKKELY
jgi:hypothetical protein|tara:strand:+ start:243 stop:563 length:321 start_codon:yes stop_codon:yes gene_type:complete